MKTHSIIFNKKINFHNNNNKLFKKAIQQTYYNKNKFLQNNRKIKYKQKIFRIIKKNCKKIQRNNNAYQEKINLNKKKVVQK